MAVFERTDGRRIEVVDGFREAAVTHRPAVTPKPDWGNGAYAASAAKKARRFERLLEEVGRFRTDLRGARVLEVGCGDAVNCMLFAGRGGARVVGVDLYLPLLDQGEKGERTRRVAEETLRGAGVSGGTDGFLSSGAVELAVMDARQLTFADATFDLLVSRSAMEHIAPAQAAVAEMIRVVRPGGLIHHSVDPFFWLRGCHKRGLTDIPWAHARLTDEEFERFVCTHESGERAAKRLERIRTLNRYSLAQWREILTSGDVEVLEYREEPDDWSVETLDRHLDAADTLLPGLTREDLTVGRINAWLRRR
jgi:ubiquinone/menaquinone biosynthesis C-methylase UbiE